VPILSWWYSPQDQREKHLQINLLTNVARVATLIKMMMAGSITQSKHASWDLASSVFLITSDGRTLSLPIPSKSHRDPLNWSKRKRAGALFSLMLFSVIGLTMVQGPSLMYEPLWAEFGDQVCGMYSSVLAMEY